MSAATTIERERILSPERTDTRPLYSPQHVLTIPSLIPPPESTKISPMQSLDIEFTRKNMEPFIELIYGSDLVLRKYNAKTDKEQLNSSWGAIVNPIARWGEGASMWISLKDQPAMSLNDMSPQEQLLVWGIHADQISMLQLMYPNRPILMGACNSAGGLDKPMSVLAAHTQTAAFPLELSGLKGKDLKRWISSQRGDEATAFMGRRIADSLHGAIPEGLEAEVGSSPLGAYIHLKNFSPQDLIGKNFQSLVKPLFLVPHEQIREGHDEIYNTPLKEIIDFVQLEGRANKQLNEIKFREQFSLVYKKPDTYRGSILYNMAQQGLSRQTFGWVFGMVFVDDEALITLHPALRKDMPAGPVENYGIMLHRPPGLQVGEQEMKQIQNDFTDFGRNLEYTTRLHRLNRQSYALPA